MIKPLKNSSSLKLLILQTSHGVCTDNVEETRIFSNKSAANYSAMNYPEALNDAKSAIENDPLFSKAW